MADSFGLKIGIEGEKEFKNALRDINQSFKVLGSEMKLVSSEFDKQDKSVAAVTARNEVLNKAIDAQKDKIATLESALKNAADSFGENDRRTQNWAVQLNNAKAELSAIGALGKLSAADLPLKTAYNVKKSIDLLQKEVDFFNQERKKLLERYGTENEDGGYTLREDTLVEAQQDMDELLSILENTVHIGLPVPQKLKDVLEQLHNRDGKEDDR